MTMRLSWCWGKYNGFLDAYQDVVVASTIVRDSTQKAIIRVAVPIKKFRQILCAKLLVEIKKYLDRQKNIPGQIQLRKNKKYDYSLP